jgi:hypothetical protein
MRGNLKKYSDGWFIESIVDDNGIKLPHPSRIRVHPEQLTNDDPYRTKYGVDDEVYFEVKTIAFGDSEFNVMDEDVAMIIETKTDTSEKEEVETEEEVNVEEPEFNFENNSKMEYRIAVGTDPLKLIISVNELLQQDWIPQGGMCVDDTYFYQAMVKIN